MIPTLDELLPDPDHRARYERRIAASQEAVWDALQKISLPDLPLARGLVGLRYLPARLAGRAGEEFLPGPIIDSPPIPVLASDPGHGLVMAGVRKPWRLLGEGMSCPRLDRDEFVAFAEPGWAKLVFDFRLEPDGTGTMASTETRILSTDRRSRLAFGVYWRAIGIPSGMIRQEMLRAMAAIAETSRQRPMAAAPA